MSPAAERAAIPEISLEIVRCPAVSRSDVARLTALELEARVVDRGGAGRQTTRVQIECDGPRAHLVVSDPLTGKQLLRTMELRARDETVAERMLALAVSELVITSWLELTIRPAAEVPSPPVPPASAAATPSPPAPATGHPASAAGAASGSDTVADWALRRAAQERAEKRADKPASSPASAGRLFAMVMAEVAGPFTRTGTQWGGGVRVGWMSRARWFDPSFAGGHPLVELDLGATSSSVQHPLGTVGVATVSATPRVSFRLTRASLWMDLGVGLRLGLARLIGEPAEPSATRGGTLAGTWTGPTAYAGAGFQWRHLVAQAGLEVGHVLRPVSGGVGERDTVAIAGQWISALVALGWGQ